MGRLGLELGSGPHVVGRLGSGMLVSASVQIIPRPVCRLGLGLGSGLRVGAGVTSRGIFGKVYLRGELSPEQNVPQLSQFYNSRGGLPCCYATLCRFSS